MLKTNLDNLDDVDRALLPHYVQAKNGKFVVDVEGYAERIADLNAEAKSHRERAEAAETKLADFKDIDPQRVVGLAEELRLSRAHEREVLVGASLTVALAKAKASATGIELLSEKLAARISVETKDGRRAVRILDAEGKPIEGATIASLVAEAREKYPGAFEGHGGSGSGAPTRSGRSPSGNSITRRDFERLPAATQMAKVSAGVTVVD